MDRKKLIAGNHKMHTTLSESLQLAKNIHNSVRDIATDVDILLIPPFTHIFAVAGVLKNTPFHTGAQNCATEKSGAFTGEISTEMLASVGATYILVGHSERRQLFGENDEVLSKKIDQAFQQNLRPIFCFGETLEQRDSGKYLTAIESQLLLLKNSYADLWKKLELAYEPVWAIGTGKNASSAQVQEIHAFVRHWISSNISPDTANTIRILYGGSVKPDNAREILSQPDVDGALVGGASLDSDSFTAIVKAAL